MFVRTFWAHSCVLQILDYFISRRQQAATLAKTLYWGQQRSSIDILEFVNKIQSCPIILFLLSVQVVKADRFLLSSLKESSFQHHPTGWMGASETVRMPAVTLAPCPHFSCNIYPCHSHLIRPIRLTLTTLLQTQRKFLPGFQDNWQKMKQSEQFILYLQKHV